MQKGSARSVSECKKCHKAGLSHEMLLFIRANRYLSLLLCKDILKAHVEASGGSYKHPLKFFL